jgi:hypothetical protein
MRSLVLMVGCIGAMLWSGLAAERSHATRTACHDLFRVKQILPFRNPPGFTPLVVDRFNADRRDDIAVMGSGGLRVMLAGVGGGFELGASRVVRVSLSSLLAGELTGDGRTDLVAASVDGRVFVLPGDGLGSFALGAPTPVQNPLVQAVGDLNADAKPDVVLMTIELNEAHLRVLLGNGAGALAESAAFPVAANGRAAAVVQDFDGDARPDLLLGGPAGATVLQILPGNGSVVFRPAVAADNRILSIDAMSPADFNEDGRLDLVAMGFGTAIVAFGDGRGHFAEPSARILLSGGGYSGRPGLNTADFNGDHHADVAVSGNDNGDVFVYLGNGRGRFRLAEGTPEYGGIYPSAPLAVGDVDGDGRPDLIGLRGGGVPALRVLRNTGGRTPRHVRAQTLSMITPEPAEVVRGEGVTLSARLRCHPGNVALYRRQLRRPRGPWRRIATTATDYRGVAEVSDQPRVTSKYQWRPTGQGKRRIKPTRRVTVRVLRRAGTAG